MSKMGSHDPFGHLKHKLWPKEKLKINWQFNSQPLKVKNHPNFLACRSHATYLWKALVEGYNFVLNLILIGDLHTKLVAPKVTKVPTLGISRLPLGNPRTKWHLGVGRVAMHKIYHKGEGGGFLQIWDMMNLVNPSLPMALPCTKNTQTTH
jgi:hypothetical protein